MEVHPSQRRLSCEACRKSKTKCRRIQADDLKCVRCALASIECDTGQQRKVGRPKRKALDPASASGCRSASKRQKASTDLEAHGTPANGVVSVQHVENFSESFAKPAQAHMGTDGVSQHLLDSRARVSTRMPMMPDLVSGEWPATMNDIWYGNTPYYAPSSHNFQETTPDSHCGADAACSTAEFNRNCRPGNHPTLSLSDFMNQVLSCNSRPWMTSDPWITPDRTSKYPLISKRSHPLPFGIGRPPTYYIHENQFSSIPADASSKIGRNDSTITLLSMVQGLQLRSNIVRPHRSRLDLSHLIQRHGPVFIGTFSLVEYVMASTEQLLQIVASLVNTSEPLLEPNEKLPTPLVSSIMDVYCRILSFFELFLQHLTNAAERIATTPVKPIPGLRYNGLVLTGAGIQGTLICSSIFYLLGRAESVLGLDTASTGNGIFSACQIVMLYKKLDKGDGLVQTRGIIRPADVKNLFMRVTIILEQLASTETA
ncbi:hypothetical protein M436DRAFT_68038 [Aureobasidium namibiae CBS 147.97]|uniref:Zn(2)-C6 fungal-type domain-containing protein n=1 Tax=Aureobasidium namibiae CBS 147.97 TaxID=1043004 RepID=A0A074WF98_9PEZI|nr:uncharacterized protein M436DRAFT_68038 [Aureobasidium namibiae CBS 147.97]KEQ68557.1 hypothetical protein M436DRAFT_68038 [Aureobasidium namibiae CBS 147.97]